MEELVAPDTDWFFGEDLVAILEEESGITDNGALTFESLISLTSSYLLIFTYSF